MKRRFLDVFGAMLSATGVAMFVPLYLDFFIILMGVMTSYELKPMLNVQIEQYVIQISKH